MATTHALPFTTFRAVRANPLRQVGGVLVAMWRAAESRRELAQLDRRMLADIGLGSAEAQAEANRAPWDLTPRRR